MCVISSDHSLFINCGGGETTNVDGNVYEQDNDTSQFYLSPEGNWARSAAGNTIYASNFSNFLESVRCGLSSETLLYNTARSSAVSLKYYGFCLRNGKYNVILHFAEIVDEVVHYRSTDKRVFDIYIQVTFFLALSQVLATHPFALLRAIARVVI